MYAFSSSIVTRRRDLEGQKEKENRPHLPPFGYLSPGACVSNDPHHTALHPDTTTSCVHELIPVDLSSNPILGEEEEEEEEVKEKKTKRKKTCSSRLIQLMHFPKFAHPVLSYSVRHLAKDHCLILVTEDVLGDLNLQVKLLSGEVPKEYI